MGKTPKPLLIIVYGGLYEWPEIRALEGQGHVIQTMGLTEADIVIGPQCWLMDEDHRQYLPDALASARAKRYPSKKGDPA